LVVLLEILVILFGFILILIIDVIVLRYFQKRDAVVVGVIEGERKLSGMMRLFILLLQLGLEFPNQLFRNDLFELIEPALDLDG
jgi:hypothetical protein